MPRCTLLSLANSRAVAAMSIWNAVLTVIGIVGGYAVNGGWLDGAIYGNALGNVAGCAAGWASMRAARRTGLTLGTLVRVPSEDPSAYADGLVETAERAHAPVKQSKGYTVLPLAGGSVVAVGVRGCATILVSAPDPSAVPFLADAVFASSA